MNWMSACLGRLAWIYILSGAAAGTSGAVLHMFSLWILTPFESSIVTAAISGMALGLGLGGLLGPVEDLVNRVWNRALKSGLIAAIVGMVSGGAAFALIWVSSPTLGAQAAYWIFLPLLFGVCGAIAGFGPGLVLGRLRNGLKRALVGGFVGLAAGNLLTAVFVIVPGRATMVLLGCAAWGALVTFVVFWVQKRTARQWLRVLTGPGEDYFFPLNGGEFTLGKLETNDIPLLNYNEVFPIHCHLKWDDDHYKIVDQDQGGVVLVNYRQVQEQELKHGDLVKLGSALLQYGEAK